MPSSSDMELVKAFRDKRLSTVMEDASVHAGSLLLLQAQAQSPSSMSAAGLSNSWAAAAAAAASTAAASAAAAAAGNSKRRIEVVIPDPSQPEALEAAPGSAAPDQPPTMTTLPPGLSAASSIVNFPVPPSLATASPRTGHASLENPRAIAVDIPALEVEANRAALAAAPTASAAVAAPVLDRLLPPVVLNNAPGPAPPPMDRAHSGHLYRRSGVIKLPEKVSNIHEEQYQNKVQGMIDRAVYVDDDSKKSAIENAREILGKRSAETFEAILNGFNATLRSSHTWVMMFFGMLSMYICNRIGLQFPVEWGILSLGTVFPLSFSMGQSYARRDSAASFVTALRVSCMSFYMMWHEYIRPETSENASLQSRFGHAALVKGSRHKADVERILVEFCNTIRLYLMHDFAQQGGGARAGALVRHVQRCLKTLYFITESTQLGRDGPAHFRAVSLLADMTRAWDDLTRLRQYKPPLSLRYAAALFVHIAPFLLAPSFAKQECGARYQQYYGQDATCPAGYVGMFILVVVLMTLYKVERDLSNPFDQCNLDDLHFDISADLVDFYALEIFALEADDIEAQEGGVFPPPPADPAAPKHAHHLAVAIDVGSEGELPKIKAKRVKEEDIRDAIWEEGHRRIAQAASLARSSVSRMNELVARATSPPPMGNGGLQRPKSICKAAADATNKHRRNKSWAGEAFEFLSPMSMSRSSRNNSHANLTQAGGPEGSGRSFGFASPDAHPAHSLDPGHAPPLHGAHGQGPSCRAPSNVSHPLSATKSKAVSSSDPMLAREVSGSGSGSGGGGSMIFRETSEEHVHGASLIQRLEEAAAREIHELKGATPRRVRIQDEADEGMSPLLGPGAEYGRSRSHGAAAYVPPAGHGMRPAGSSSGTEDFKRERRPTGPSQRPEDH